jgi:hypothetical protein
MPRKTVERHRDLMPGFGPDVMEHGLDDRHHVIGGHKGGLEVDLGEFRLTVRPQVLVAEATCDLEIAVIASHHQQLLVDLRRLREGVAFARVHAAGHQVVARTLGSRLGEDRGLDLQKSQLTQRAARPLREAVAQDQVGLQFRSTQIEDTMLQPQVLCSEFFAFAPRHRNGRGRCRSDHLDAGHAHLHLARPHRGIARRLGAPLHDTIDHDHGLGAEPGRACEHLGRRPGRITGELDQPVPVPEVEEDDAAEVAAPVDPAAEANSAADVGSGE